MEQLTVLKKATSEKNQEVSQYLQKLSTRVSSEDLKILEKKYAEKPISLLTDAELLTKTAECLLHIHIITGWNLPDDQDYIKILTEQLLNKLKEDFYMLNFSEIYFAFRQATGKKDWGKNMNLELICSVLGSYCVDRSVVSFEEEKINTKPEYKIYSDEEILNQRRAEIETAYQAIRKGYYPLLHIYFDDVLKADGLLAEYDDPENENEKKYETVGEFFVRRLNSQAENIYVR